jgi:hypothetical protein
LQSLRGGHNIIYVWAGLHINFDLVWGRFCKIGDLFSFLRSPRRFPYNLRRLFEQMLFPQSSRGLCKITWVWVGLPINFFRKVRGAFVKLIECGLDYLLISIICEFFLNVESHRWFEPSTSVLRVLPFLMTWRNRGQNYPF